MDSLMISSPSTLTTHAGWSVPKTNPYWSSTLYLGCYSPMNHRNKINPYQSARSQEKSSLTNARLVWDGTSKPTLHGYSYQDKKRQTGYNKSEHT